MTSPRYAYLLPVMLLFTACNVRQFLPEDELLYRGASLELQAPDTVATTELETELNAVLDNEVNQKIPLIGYRNIWRYYKFEEKKARKPEKYEDDPDEIKGEEPIFYDEAVVEGIQDLLENRAANSGYFTSEATFTTDTSYEDREVRVNYTVSVGPPHRLDSITTFWRDSSIARVLNTADSERRLQPGDRYDLDNIKAERQRWREELKHAGYFYAIEDDFVFLADTVSGDHEVDLLAKLKEEVPQEHLMPQRIVAVNVYPDFDLEDTLRRNRPPSAEVGGLTIYCEECPLRPKILDEGFAIESGMLYNPDRHRRTLRRLASYNTFRYISLDYEQLTDSTLALNAYMEPLLRRRVEGELGLTYNSARYIGPNVRLAYTNRNLLRGAELLQIEGDFSYAVFLGEAAETRVPRSGIYGLNATLNVPRLWLPKRRKLIPRVMNSGTVINIGGKLESLSLILQGFSQEIRDLNLTELRNILEEDESATERVSLLQLRAQYGYTWQRRVTKSHILYPLSIRFQDPVVSNQEVLSIARELGLAPNQEGGAADGASRFDRMLVFSPNYTLTLDSRLNGLSTHEFFWRQYVSMNWNNVFPIGTAGLNQDRILSVYPQLQTDLRYYLTFTTGSQLAMRAHGGIAFPITERAIVPYFDLYTVGGPNSLRGFIPRQLGPGRTAPVNNNLLTFGGYGNLLFESSIEYRQRVIPLLELAAFLDAGNVWTYKTEAEPLDTDFRRTEFINELAMNYGVGFRFDLTFLILRIDLAKPFQIPYEETVAGFRIPQRYVGDQPNDDWRVVIAFGYPF